MTNARSHETRPTTDHAIAFDPADLVPNPSRARVMALDLLRGVVMILMAVDHVRVYSGVPPGGPEPAVFFTRWITHFCAPVFVFLAGTGAFLYGRRKIERGGSRSELARFLVTRGTWLVVLELTVVRLAWTFNAGFSETAMGGVIWAIGWSMVLMGAIVYLPLRAIGVFGLGIILFHNAVGEALGPSAQGVSGEGWGRIAQVVYNGGAFRVGGKDGVLFLVLYSLVPWVGVMAAGYAFGWVMRQSASVQRRLCMGIGFAAIALFLLLRGFNLYGDPRPWAAPPEAITAAVGQPSTAAPPAGPPTSRPLPAVLSFLNTTKYPASLAFLLMTLGPAIAVIPFLSGARGAVARIVAVFGRVPLFYYLLHIPVIHLLAIGVSLIRTGNVDPWLLMDHPALVPPPPDGYPWSLPLLYAITGVAVVMLYFPCRWFAALKQRRRDRWLSLL